MKSLEVESMSSSQKEMFFGSCNDMLARVEGARSLPDLLSLHKEAWSKGIRNDNLGPNEYGMFRCEDISKLSQDNVYLGGVYGFNTLPLSSWENSRNAGRITGEDYRLIMNQYRSHLTSNIKAVRSQVYDSGIDRDRVTSVLQGMADRDKANVRDIRIESPALTVGDLHPFSFKGPDGSNRSSTILLTRNSGGSLDVFVPRNWTDGQQVSSRKAVGECQWRSLVDGNVYDLKPSLMNRLGLDRDLSRASKMKI